MCKWFGASQSTAKADRTLKKELYQNRFRTPEYFWVSPEHLEFEGFRLVGHEYQPIAPNSQGWRWSEELGLYLGVEAEQLRYFNLDGTKVPTLEEALLATQAEAISAKSDAAVVENQLAQEKQARETAQQRVEQLAERLRALGIDPDTLA